MLRTIVIGGSIFILLLSAQTAIFLLYLSRDLGLPPSVIGLLLAVGAVGALLGAMLASSIARRVGVGPSLIAGALLFVPFLVIRGFAVGPTEVVVVTLATAQLIGLFVLSIFNLNSPSLRQALTPPRLLGRVNASYRFLVWGTGPIGALLGGILGETLGLRTALLLSGLASIAVLPIFIASPLMALREMPAPKSS